MQMEQCQPPRLAKAGVAQPVVEQLAPAPGGFGDAHADASMVSVHIISLLIIWQLFKRDLGDRDEGPMPLRHCFVPSLPHVSPNHDEFLFIHGRLSVR